MSEGQESTLGGDEMYAYPKGEWLSSLRVHMDCVRGMVMV